MSDIELDKSTFSMQQTEITLLLIFQLVLVFLK